MMKNSSFAKIRMNKYAYEADKLAARMLGLSFSSLVRIATEDYLKKHLSEAQKQAIFDKTGHLFK